MKQKRTLTLHLRCQKAFFARVKEQKNRLKQKLKHAFTKLRKQHGEKTCSYQIIPSRHSVTTTCVTALFPHRYATSNVLVQFSPYPLSGPATRWWPCPKSYLPLVRGQRYRPGLTPPIPAACSTAPWEPDAFMQVGWLSSINSILNGGTPFRDQGLLQTHLPCDQLPWTAQEGNNCYTFHYCFKDLFYWCAI